MRIKLGIPANTSFIFKSDNGTEFVNAESAEWLYTNLVEQQLTSPYNPHQNGIAERTNRTLAEAALCMLIHSRAPLFLWHVAFLAAGHVEQFLPTTAFEHPSSSYIELFNEVPDISYIRTFGCDAYMIVPDTKQSSFGVRAVK
jgi:transposase InsO family protein